MNTPHFISQPVSDTETETIKLLVKGFNVKQIAELRYLENSSIAAHTKNLRFKFHCNTIYGVISHLYALGIVTRAELIEQLPADWQQYIRP